MITSQVVLFSHGRQGGLDEACGSERDIVIILVVLRMSSSSGKLVGFTC